MGTSSGGLLKTICQGPFGQHVKLSFIYRKLAINIFTLTLLCSLVLCKQQSNSYDGNQFRHFDSVIDEHEQVRQKRDISGGFNSLETVHYCSFGAPLKTKYLIPYYEANRDVKGCASAEKTKHGIIVHVVQLNTTASNVLLTVSDNDKTSGGMILLLDSLTPVKWRLTFAGSAVYPPRSAYNRIVYISKGSEIYFTNVRLKSANQDQGKSWNIIDHSISQNIRRDGGSVANLIRQTWGAVTTFSRISGANRISISLPAAEGLSTRCIIENDNSAIRSPSSSPSAVLAYMVSKQPASGCFHEEAAGHMTSDVHVIDLGSAEENINNTFNSEGSEGEDVSSGASDPSHLPAVYLSLAPEGRSSSHESDIMHRNLTLILNSKQRVKWYLESKGLSGQLKVISTNGPVENYSLASSQQLIIERNPLPAAFDQLWKAVVTKTGSAPLSYAHVDTANVVTIIVPSKSKQGSLRPEDIADNKARLLPDPNQLMVSHHLPSRSGHLAKEIILVPGLKKNSKSSEVERFIDRLEKSISAHLIRKCSPAGTNITLPISATKGYDVVGVTLEDEHCVGTKNETHWILTTPSTSCGSINFVDNSHPIMENNVHLKFAEGSKYFGMEVHLPVICRFRPGAFLSSSNAHTDDTDNYDGYDDSVNKDSNVLYRMIVSRQSKAAGFKGSKVHKNNGDLANKKQHPNSEAQVLLTDRLSVANVHVGDRIKVSANFDTRLAFGIAIEKCWLSNHDTSDEKSLPDDNNWLVWKGCPPNIANDDFKNENNVTMLPNPSRSSPSFTFDVTRRQADMRKIYIFCLMGLCSSDQIKAGDVGGCVDPSVSCASRKTISSGSAVNSKNHIAPTAQQLVRRGPLFVKQNVVKLSSQNQLNSSFPFNNDLVTFPKVLVDVGYTPNPKIVLSTLGSSAPEPLEEDNSEKPKRNLHGVMVGVPVPFAVAIALASFVIGASLAGILCCIHHRKSTPKVIHQGDGVDPSTEGSELQSMIASPTLQSPFLHGSNHHNGTLVVNT